MAVVVIGRDFILNTIRMFGKENGETISAGVYGKIKTASQMIGVSLAIIDTHSIFAFLELKKTMGVVPMLINVSMSIFITVALIFTIWSMIDYFMKYKKYIDIEK